MMPPNFDARAIKGAIALVTEADNLFRSTLAEVGPRATVSPPDTSYYLPTILGMTGKAVDKAGDLQFVIERARKLLHPVTAGRRRNSDSGDVLHAGIAALLAAETIEALRFAQASGPRSAPNAELGRGTSFSCGQGRAGQGPDGSLHGPIDDLHTRAWGIQLVDGRMPGFAVIVGSAKSNEAAARIVRELQDRNILCLVCGRSESRSIIKQLQDEGISLDHQTRLIPLGSDTISAVYAIGFATRCAMMLGGLRPGVANEILVYNRERTPGFVLTLGEMDDAMYAIGAGASNFGLPLITDTVIPQNLQRAADRRGLLSVPFETVDGKDDLEKAAGLVQRCIELCSLKIKASNLDIPVRYGSAFEGEEISDADLSVELGGQRSCGFELLEVEQREQVIDGKIDIIGPEPPRGMSPVPMDTGIVIQVSGHKLQPEYEPVLEQRIHDFIDCTHGVQHVGKRDSVGIRLSNAAVGKGFSLQCLGKVLHGRMHDEFGAVVEKAQIKIITDPQAFAHGLAKARLVYVSRDKRLAELTDEKVDEFYSCALCKSFAPNHVCIVSPERIGPCGMHTWLDCRASFMINPTGAQRPIRLGRQLDARKGVWEGINNHVRLESGGILREASMYSIMQNPLTACAGFECIVMFIPETNGVMVVSHEDPSMTPAGLTFSALAAIAASGQQTSGVMGIGKAHVVSRKFISADGGFKRIVWMSSVLKESMPKELQAACVREGDPNFLDRIADERKVASLYELLAWLRAQCHPALEMEPMF
jgi:acetyl-CoA synthase